LSDKRTARLRVSSRGRSVRALVPRVFSKYMTAKVAKIVLATRRLRGSSPLLFNDPFDITQELRLDFDEYRLNATLTDQVGSLMEQGDLSTPVTHPVFGPLLRGAMRLGPDARRTMASELRRRIGASPPGQAVALKVLKDTWRAMVPTFRVLCLSEVHDATSIWNHYADRYQGVVLQFVAVKEVDSAFLIARPVVYQDTAPSIADVNTWVSCMLGQGEKSYQDLFTEYLYVKKCEWSYEKEWRIPAPGRRPEDSELFGDYGFHPSELTAIYFGPKCSEEDCSDLLKLLAHGLEHVQAHEMFLNVI
jgi:hypothetical protein